MDLRAKENILTYQNCFVVHAAKMKTKNNAMCGIINANYSNARLCRARIAFIYSLPFCRETL